MSLGSEQRYEIENVVETSLIRAEMIWAKYGSQLKEVASDELFAASLESELVPSKIPNHPIINSDHPQIGDFIALVADMRESSKHLLCEISPKTSSVSMLNRIYYETSALLPALELTIKYESGFVTEYLGDGVLSLFQSKSNDREESILQSYRAAENCIGDTRDIVNDVLYRRYRLPDLDIGVGLSFSKAIIDVVGIPGNRHAKVIGRCVYNASKLCSGINEIYADSTVKELWPTDKNGKIVFRKRNLRGVEGFLVGSNNK